ncbi:Voltage-gated Ion Channel (VIC) Superfamily [Thraustotheca clavata]|uniref:Voltage-gated Ion Channel (VIC) Superfamily n=1 Tax=Thraustotheca clavata TaxID=74557 RepID=A0A1V9Y6S0_9STRA|nr:Voltage-gated Ion Channel (VIC) Superfamily [Thraustotheca clavata]
MNLLPQKLRAHHDLKWPRRGSNPLTVFRNHSLTRVAPGTRQVKSNRQIDTFGSFQLRRGSLSWEIRHKKTRTIDPDSFYLASWNIMLLFFCFYNAMVIPLLMCFDHSACQIPALEGILYVAEAFFAIDVAVQMHTGYYLSGDLVRNPILTRRKYLRSWSFPMDVLSLIPLYLLLNDSVSCGYLHMNKLFRLRRAYSYTLDFDKVFARYFKFCKVVKVVVVSFAFCHLSACIYAAFGFNHDEESVWKLTHELEHHDVLTQYFGALNWAIGIVSKCHEGEIPRSLWQMIFMLIVMAGGFLLFVYICGTLFMISKCDANTIEKFDAKINQLRYVLSFHRVPTDIQERAVEFLENEFKSGESNDKSNMKLLCPSIAKDVKFTLLKNMVAGVPFFRCCNAAFIRALIDLMETSSLPTNYVVCEKGDQGEDMYFVQAGVLAVIINDIKVRELRKGGFFGELSLFTNQVRTATVVTATFCILHKLSRTHVQRVLHAYPEFEGQILQCVGALLHEMDMHNNEEIIRQRGSFHSQDAIKRAKAYGNYVHKVNGQGDKRFSRRFVDLLPPTASSDSQTQLPVSSESSTQPPIPESPKASSISRTSSAMGLRPREGAVFWHKLLLRTALDRKARYRLYWLLAVTITTLYNLFIVPLANAFVVVGHPTSIVILNTVADIILWLDIYGKFNLSYVVEAESIFNTVKCAKYYLRTDFWFDLMCVFPYWFFYPPYHLILRLGRLLRVYNCPAELEEIALFVRIDSKRRIFILGLGLFFCYHLAGCTAQAYTFIAGYGESMNGWLPPEELELTLNDEGTTYTNYLNETFALDDPHVTHIITLQYLRALYYGAVCLTNLGRPLEPETFGEYLLACCLMLIGMLLISTIIDEVQKRVTASAVEQMEFLSTRSRIQLFLQKQKAPLELHRRVSAFLDFWWSAHRGANINELISELPTPLRREILSFICAPAIDTIARMEHISECFTRLSAVFLDNLAINLYGQSEMVYRCGDYADCIYVLLEGEVKVFGLNRSSFDIPLRELKSGDFFGLSSLAHGNDNVVHGDQAKAITTCVVALVSRSTLATLYQIFPSFPECIASRKTKGHSHLTKQQHLEPNANGIMQRKKRWMINPDSNFSVFWETLLFFGMVYQSIGVPFYMAFGFDDQTVGFSDSISIILEICFFCDIFLKFRTGYLYYGNKVMDLDKTKARYLHSYSFAIDVLAVIPFNLANLITNKPRSEAWNVNKLLRLFKLSAQIEHLERQYYTINIQIRIFKLVFYIYLLSHFIGCTWYNFGSNASTLLGFTTSKQFGTDAWLPGTSMDTANSNLTLLMKYAKAHYWGLGLLLGFNPGQFPASAVEYLFTILVQTLGVFLLAYVVGNLLDIVQILDGNNRVFYSNLNYVRKFLTYFTFTEEMMLKIEHFYFYRLFHSIHEEHILAKCLPPSLVADIRLYLLTPMLNKVRFFQDESATSNITRVLVSQMTQMLVVRGDVVVRQNEAGVDMYFVFSGCLHVFVHFDKSSTTFIDARGLKVNEIHAGAFFGEKSLFSDKPRNATIEAKTFCTLYKLSRKHLESVFVQHPDWKKKVMKIVNQMYAQQALKIQEEQLRSQSDLSKFPSVKCIKQLADIERKFNLRSTLAKFVKKLLYVEVQSPFYNTYLKILCISLLYIALSVPYVLTFGNQGLSPGVFIMFMIFNVLTDAVFAYDIWFKQHTIETTASREFYEETTATRHTQWLDILTIFPFDYIVGPFYNSSGLFRLNRFLKLRQLTHTINEVHRFSMSYEINRLQLLGLYYFMGCYWVACFYFGLTFIDGFSPVWNASLPVAYFAIDPNATAEKIFFRLFRCMYFAMTLNTGTGIVYEPDNRFIDYTFIFIMSVFGVFVMGYVIGEASTLCIYLIQNEVDFKIHQMNVMEFLVRKRMNRSIESRVHAFLSFSWSSQSGVMYQSILEQLPLRIRSQANLQIGHMSIARFSMRYLRPLCKDMSGIEFLTSSVAHRLVFEAYPPGESVIVQGNIGQTMYFVSKGNLISASSTPHFIPTRFVDGQFFGEEGFLSANVCMYSVVTLRACDLLALSASDFLTALHESPGQIILFKSILIVFNRFSDCIAIVKQVLDAIHEPENHPTIPSTSDIGELLYHVIHENISFAPYQNMTIEECETMFTPFLALFDDPAEEMTSKPFEKESIRMCQHCDHRASTVYCKFCLQSLCFQCSQTIHEQAELVFHLETISTLKVASPKKRMSTVIATVEFCLKKIKQLSRHVVPMLDEEMDDSIDEDVNSEHVPVINITHEMLEQNVELGQLDMTERPKRKRSSRKQLQTRLSSAQYEEPQNPLMADLQAAWKLGPSTLRATTFLALKAAAKRVIEEEVGEGSTKRNSIVPYLEADEKDASGEELVQS